MAIIYDQHCRANLHGLPIAGSERTLADCMAVFERNRWIDALRKAR